uniref:Putative gut cathepsin L-like cysteine protease n=1 Tax=Callosobruchus maculatus TaxID=64391 RepID=Q717S0_CALMS|nr:putative gut cathepsin L-like cysteine protease [Callosobruchus maculatus]
MKFLVVVATLVLVAGASSVYEEWQQFKLDHGKTYRSVVEEKRRFSVFQKNLIDIQEHNKKYERGEVSFAKKVTQFADMTHEEFLDLLKLQGVPALPSDAVYFEETDIEEKDAVDWRKEGAVTPVKNQGHCGSCWAFSAVGAIEGQFFKKNGTLVSLSAQELVDCATEYYGNEGCNGGLMGQAFDFVEDEGIQTEESYPYKAKRSICQMNGEYVTKVKTYHLLLNEQEIARAVSAKGPVAVAIDASQLSFYDQGIVDEKCKCSKKREDLNHGVLVVGYGSENGVDYWIVKNSWGADWGEKGYFRLKKDVKACGIGNYNTYPVLL